jgi:transcriptional regulator with XRE-family HTH domain
MSRPRRKEPKGIAERIRLVASSVGTQAEAARRAEVSLRQMQKYLSGKSKPSLDALARLSASTGFSLEWLRSGEGPERYSEPLPPGRRPTDAQVTAAAQTSLAALREERPVVLSEAEAALTAVTNNDASAWFKFYEILDAAGRIPRSRFSGIAKVYTSTFKCIEEVQLVFRSNVDKNALVAKIWPWLNHLSTAIERDEDWDKATIFASHQLCNAVKCISSIADDLMSEGTTDEAVVRLSIALTAHEIIFGQLKHIEFLDLASLAVRKGARSAKSVGRKIGK